MKKVLIGFVVAALIGCVVLLFLQHQAQKKLRTESEALVQQHAQPTDAIQSLPSPEQASFNRKHIQTINAAKLFNLAMRVYAKDNDNLYPTNFNEKFVNQLKTGRSMNLNMADWLDVFEFMPGVTSAESAEKHPDGIILREKKARQAPDGKWERVYSYADGSAWFQTSDDGNFAAFEKQHMFPPANQ